MSKPSDIFKQLDHIGLGQGIIDNNYQLGNVYTGNPYPYYAGQQAQAYQPTYRPTHTLEAVHRCTRCQAENRQAIPLGQSSVPMPHGWKQIGNVTLCPNHKVWVVVDGSASEAEAEFYGRMLGDDGESSQKQP